MCVSSSASPFISIVMKLWMLELGVHSQVVDVVDTFTNKIQVFYMIHLFQALVSLAKNIFETTEVVRDVVKRIMMQAQELLDCERCTVYLVDTDADENMVYSFTFPYF